MFLLTIRSIKETPPPLPEQGDQYHIIHHSVGDTTLSGKQTDFFDCCKQSQCNGGRLKIKLMNREILSMFFVSCMTNGNQSSKFPIATQTSLIRECASIQSRPLNKRSLSHKHKVFGIHPLPPSHNLCNLARRRPVLWTSPDDECTVVGRWRKSWDYGDIFLRMN